MKALSKLLPVLIISSCAAAPNPNDSSVNTNAGTYAPQSLTGRMPQTQGSDPVPLRRLGEAYDFGRGVKQSYSEAAKWYQQAADLGDGIAQNNLGSLYQNGLGVPTNHVEAIRLYRKAADQGLAMAQNNLGAMYDGGLGTAKDQAEANVWFRRAAEQGYPDAMYNLGLNYSGGFGVEQDLAEAYKWIDLARFYSQKSQNMKVKWTIRRTYDALEKRLPKELRAEGRRRAKEWDKNHRHLD